MSQTKKITVAIVEDEVEIAESIKDSIEHAYNVETFVNPELFLNALDAKAISPVVLVSDLKMPKMTGLEMLREIKKRHVYLPTILFSGYLEKKDAIEALELGVVSVLEKPFDIIKVPELVDRTIIDYEIKRTVKQLKEVYSVLRFALPKYVPQEVVDKVFFAPPELVQASGGKNMDALMEELESNLDVLLLKENILHKKKGAQ